MTKAQLFKTLLIILAILIAAAGSYAAWQTMKNDDTMPDEVIASEDQEAVPETQVAESEIDTSDWQTYRNEEYGFEVKIPNTWPDFNVRERPISDGTKVLDFGFADDDVKNWGDIEDGYVYMWGLWVFTKEQFAGHYRPDGVSKPAIFQQNEEYVFVKSHGNDLPSETSDWMTESELVFATFKFAESDFSTSAWQTYRNEEYGFEFMYPAEKLELENNRQDEGNFFSALFIPVDKDEQPDFAMNLGGFYYCDDQVSEYKHLTQQKSIEEYREFIIGLGGLKEYASFTNNGVEWFYFKPLKTKAPENYEMKTYIAENQEEHFYQFSFYFKTADEKYFTEDEFDLMVRTFKTY